jgi:ectoine hydroxylase-related dioxygenase (phytanoyl-CoA dioxygenase family)
MKEQLDQNRKTTNKEKRFIKNSKMFLRKSMIIRKPTSLDCKDNFVMMKEQFNQNQKSTSEHRG